MKKNLLMMMILSLVVIFAGCGNGDETMDNQENASDENQTEEQSGITVTDLEGQTVEFDQAPEKIIPLSAGDLETIYALGGEAVGRPVIRGEVPEYVEDVPEIGTSNDVNMEKITSLAPDLVIAHPQLNADNVPALEEMGVDVLFTGADTIDDIKTSIEMMGAVLEKEEDAEELIAEIDAKIDDLKENNDNELRTLIVFGVPGNWMVALPDSLSGSMLEAVGGYNIAEDYPKLERFPQYAQLDTEKIVEADPEAIFLVTPAPTEDITEDFSEEMETNPAWQSIDAVQNGHVVTLPNELFGASPGAKIIDSLDYLQEEIQAIQSEKNKE